MSQDTTMKLLTLTLILLFFAILERHAKAQPKSLEDSFEIAGISRTTPAQLDALLPMAIPGLGTRTKRYEYPTGIRVILSQGYVSSWALTLEGAKYLFETTKDPTLDWLIRQVFGQSPASIQGFGTPVSITSNAWIWRSSNPAVEFSAFFGKGGRVELVAMTNTGLLEDQRKFEEGRKRLNEKLIEQQKQKQAAAAWRYPDAVWPMLQQSCMRRASPVTKQTNTSSQCECFVKGLRDEFESGVSDATHFWGRPTFPGRIVALQQILKRCGGY